MASIEVGIVKCPSCNCAVDFHVLNYSSLLGPTAVECHWCGTIVGSDRQEWWQMHSRHKTWFFCVSFVYVILAVFSGGLGTTTGLYFLKSGGHWREEWGLEEPAFWIGGIVWGIIVILIQLYRIRCSLNRNTELEQIPLRRSLWSFQVGGQIKLLVLLFVFPTICWVISYFGMKIR